jgi:hypothetical protein
MHLIGDWVLQNDWMAVNKQNLKHPAAWIHVAIHVVLLFIVLGWPGAVVLGALHMMIDTRIPFRWWTGIFKMTTEGPLANHVAIWTDQVFHVLCIAAWVHFFAV